MAQLDSFLGNLDSEELNEFYSMTPEEQKQIRLELEAEQAEEDRLAESERITKAAASFKKAKQTPHTDLTDIIRGSQDNVIAESYGPDSKEGLTAQALANDYLKKNNPPTKSLHPTARLLQERAAEQSAAAAGLGSGDKVTSAISEANHPLANKGGLKDARVIGEDGGPTEDDKIAEEYEQQFLSEEALREQFDPEERKRPEWLQDIVEDPTKLTGGQKPAWLPEGDGTEVIISDEGGEGIISDEDFADQLLLDEQRKSLKNPKAKDLDISTLPEKRQDEIQKLFDEKDPEAELIASEYEAEAAIKDARDRRKKLRRQAPEKEVTSKTTGDFVNFDKNGYPVYKKGSKWSKSFNDAFAKSLEQEGNKTFSWTGHDGKSRSYTNDRAVKTIEEAPKKPTVGRDRSEQFISRYVEAPKKEKAEILKKEVDETPDVQDKKDIIAEAKESGPDKYWQDPITGFTFNLSKANRRRDRERIMKMGAMLPAEDRAPFFESKGLIDSEDLKAILKPTDKENFERRVKEMELRVKSSQLVLNDKKIKNYMTPEKKEYFSAYKNAIQHSSTQGIYTFGKLLGLNDSELTKIVNENTKLALSKVKGKEKDQFKARFGMSYDKIYNSREKIMMQTASVFDPGMYGEAMQIGGTTYKGRKGLMESFKLKELNEIKSPKNYFKELEKNHSMEVSRFFKIPRYLNKDGSRNYKKLLDSPMAYQEFLQNILINAHMEKTTQGRYGDMERYRTALQRKHEAESAELIKALTARK